MRGFLTQSAFKLLAWIPLFLGRALGRSLGWLNYVMDTQAVKVTTANIQLCFPEMDDFQQQTLIKESLSHTGQMMFETPRVWMRSIEDNGKLIKAVHNESLLDESMSKNTGTIILLPHLGNWEMFNIYFARRGKMTALYSPPRKPYLQSMMAEVRKKFGNDMVPTTRKGIAQLYRQLNSGAVVTILPDQVPATGILAPFFGISTRTDVLVSRLAQKTGAEIVCAVVERTADGFEVHLLPPHQDVYSSDLNTSVTAVNASVEKCVRLMPAQYQWEYKRFKHRPEGEDRMYQFRRPV